MSIKNNTKINTKTNTKTKKNINTINTIYNILIIILIIIVFLLFIYVLLNKNNNKNINNKNININNKNINNKSNFDDTTIPKATLDPNDPNNMYGEGVHAQANAAAFEGNDPPVMSNSKGCSTNSDIVGFCTDYDNCCVNNISANNTCMCQHPYTQSCKIQYDACMNDPTSISLLTKQQLTDKCKLQNSECCKAYNKIDISSSNFTSLPNAEQNNNILCQIMSVKNIEDKCMEMCKTNPLCKGYSTTKLTCKLYSDINPYTPRIDMSTLKPITNPNINFYKKN